MDVERRSGRDRRRNHWNPRENWYRDVLLLFALGLMAYSVYLAAGASGRSNQAIRRAQQGRATAVAIICAALDAEVAAGQHVIGTTPPESSFDRVLEKLGYPPRSQRVAAARKASALYASSINARVERELRQVGVGIPAHLVRKDGTIDCKVMLSVANVPQRFIH